MKAPKRVDRNVALRLLGAAGTTVTLTESRLVKDVDGDPLGVTLETSTGTLVVSPELLGWTREELGLDDEAKQ